MSDRSSPRPRAGRVRRHLPAILACVLAGAGPAAAAAADVEARVAELLSSMTLAEKIGQLTQVNGAEGTIPDSLREAVAAGRIGSILNEVDVDVVNELQRIAVEESRGGVPLLMGRDVIHGFRTVLPIPLGLAATWNPELVRRGARIAAVEAAASGINWTFAPMIDISRDPRWGRIAESFGEDPYLTGVLGAAMVRGFQGDELSGPASIAACAKHFAGYGASESGRDYNTTNIPENELRNVYLPPFRAAVDAGVASVMTSFSDLNGIPATGNRFLMTEVLRDEWGFDGFVVSDWAAIEQLSVHGLTANDEEAALAAIAAGVNMDMASMTFAEQLPALAERGRVEVARIDEMVADILRIKLRLGLFENPYTDPADYPPTANEAHLEVAYEAALESVVLLRNEGDALPLAADTLSSLAVIGPMADEPYEQLGTWIFDGDPSLSVTPLAAIRESVGAGVDLRFVRGMETTRSRSTDAFAEARAAALDSDAVLLFLGEESILSGESHSRADIGLPGSQRELVRALAGTGRPLIGVILAGRPLTLADVVDEFDALLYAFHPGTMGGRAISDILFGAESPSGKLPVTFPGVVGQVPVYYAHKNTGKPPKPGDLVDIERIEKGTPQTSVGFSAFFLDAGYEPLYPFGYGLSYTEFSYSDIRVAESEIGTGEAVTVTAVVANDGGVAADEVVQLYVRDLVGSVTRPVRELKDFRRVRLEPGERRTVRFTLEPDDLAFHGPDMRPVIEPGEYHVWVGGSSAASLRAEFRLVDD